MNVSDKATSYAEGKANEFIKKAIAQAYADGYQDGYNDREAEIPVDLRDNKTEYVDLGLPSGTLWAADYEKVNGEILYLTYGKAQEYSIPTEEQWKELMNCCRWEYDRDGDRSQEMQSQEFDWAKCIGPNGNILTFNLTGIITADEFSNRRIIVFWLKDESDNIEKKTGLIYKETNYPGEPHRGNKTQSKEFSGYHLAVRLVK